MIIFRLLAAALMTAVFVSAAEGLSRAEAEESLKKMSAERAAELRKERAAEMEGRALKVGEKELRWMEKTFGEAPEGKRSLWISMHGGGGAPARVNDRQWTNQASLYQPEEGIYVAPRAPTDTWNLWHEAHIDPMFDRLIEDFVALRGVDPDRVYLLGYSAGGDGVWQLAPRMADRWAAAAMMAGHPNEASLLGLRNLPFALFVGGADSAYGRNTVVAERGKRLDELQAGDPEGYVHFARVYEGLPHWMNRKDAEALPWMANHTRNPWPKKIVWFQDDVTHARFYWLAIPVDEAKAGQEIVAEVSGQTIRITGEGPKSLTLRLSDALLDLDQPVQVWANGNKVFDGKIARTVEAIRQSLQDRADARSAATATLTVELGR